jgi:uncharacterized protein involved in tolerance to divalent cations
MKKQYAQNLLGGTPMKAAAACNRTVQAIYQWEDPLTDQVEALVMLAFSRLPKSQQRKNKLMADSAVYLETEK